MFLYENAGVLRALFVEAFACVVNHVKPIEDAYKICTD